MCTHTNPNFVLLQVQNREYKIPVCHVECCDMQKLDERSWIELVTQPIQTAFQAKQLEFKVRDLTTQLTKINKTIEKQQLKKG